MEILKQQLKFFAITAITAMMLIVVINPRTFAQANKQSASGSKQPNILVIWGDDIGWENVSAYGLE